MTRTLYRGLLLALVAALLAQASPTGAATASSWKTYANRRYGYTVSFPRTWAMEPESANGDGRLIRSSTRDVLTVWGGFSDFAPTDAGYDNVTMSKDLSDGWVESGYTPTGSIFYPRLRQTPDMYAVMLLVYPKSRKAAMDATVTRMSKTFAAPCTVDAAECG